MQDTCLLILQQIHLLILLHPPLPVQVQYAITDVVVMVREVADHQDILRSLAKTVLVRLLAKKQVRMDVAVSLVMCYLQSL